MDIPLILGYAGTLGLVTMLVPQIQHILKSKDSSGTTWAFICIQLYVCICFLFYGISISAYPVIVSNGILFFQNLLLARLKVKYIPIEQNDKSIIC